MIASPSELIQHLATPDWKSLAIAVILPLIGGGLGSVAVANNINTWYRGINKPSWNPPDWLFGPVWTALYAMMGLASYLVWLEGGFEHQAVPLGVYGLQLLLNILWTPLFFGAHRLDLATADIIGMWVSIVATITLFRPVIGDLALILLVPYLAWVTYATALTMWIWRHNPTSGRGAVKARTKAA